MGQLYEETVSALSEQAIRPPGRDPYIASFNTALVSMLSIERSPISTILSTVEGQRANLTSSQAVSLLLRSIQYMLLKSENGTYPADSLLEPAGWKNSIQGITDDPKLRDELTQLLLDRDTTTTIPNRYIGLRTVVNAFFNGTARTLDVGCSIPIGLDSARREDGITTITDHTEGEFISLRGNIPISHEIAIGTDITDPFFEDAKRWREACGCYPFEIKKGGIEKQRKREETMQQEGITFVQKDITEPNLSLSGFGQEKPFDCIQMATILYQLPPEKQMLAVQNAWNLLNEGGVLIIQDFVAIDETKPLGLNFLDNWGEKEAYKTIAFIKSGGNATKPLDLLHWDSGRCGEVFPGRDFHVLQEASMATTLTT